MDIALHTCGTGCAHDCGAQARAERAVARRDRSQPVIDMHCHALAPAVEPLVAGHPGKQAEWAAFTKAQGDASNAHNAAVMLPQAGPRLTSLAARIADMDAMGVDIQVLSPSPSQNCYWAEPELAREVVRLQNEAIAEACATHPERLLGFANVAMQHPQIAAAQLEHAVKELGFRGVQISTQIDGADLGDPKFAPFWAKAEALGAVVFIHPFGTTLGQRLDQWYLFNVVGQPLETTVALSHLIFGGVLDRHEKLKILAAHGGGYLPSYIGRAEHGYRVRPEAGQPKHRPSDYLRRQIWMDTLVCEPAVLDNLVRQYGASRLVVGTDYPFDMGAYDIHALLDALPGLDAAQREAILGGNARRLLDL